MPLNLAAKLLLPSGFRPASNIGQQLHGLVFNLIESQDAALAAAVHDGEGPKPFTISGLRARNIDGKKVRWFRVTALDKELEDVLPEALSQAVAGSLDLRLGTAQIKLGAFPEGQLPFPLETHKISYQQLATAGLTDDMVTLEFVSPTAFNLSGKAGLIPEPSLCFKHYLRRWTAFSDYHVLSHEEIIELVKAFREKIHLQRFISAGARTRLRQYTQNGFVGKAVFRVDDNAGQVLRNIIGFLADFSFYCGTGYKTTMGMGQSIRRNV